MAYARFFKFKVCAISHNRVIKSFSGDAQIKYASRQGQRFNTLDEFYAWFDPEFQLSSLRRDLHKQLVNWEIAAGTTSDICNENESKSINYSKIINPEHKRWWLKVPVQINKRKKLWIRMLGDSEADHPCANLKCAFKHFRDQICKDKNPVIIHTGGGTVTPEYCLWLSFPTSKDIQIQRNLFY